MELFLDFLRNLTVFTGILLAGALYLAFVVYFPIDYITEGLWPYQDKDTVVGLIWMILAISVPISAIITYVFR
ncbi:MAG: hypothetical protein Unbinned2691contig1000_56 [Prokaryotic dsDNA virus sp.]|nr:MAG: hypothetical protein Unbinned2691contig1000_56 [Prokaryotic dsDNA virus sp.]|tara:strand:- start:12020 stop:12238 length:219 start_codon:yes stop_codon:yes gene_type:complete